MRDRQQSSYRLALWQMPSITPSQWFLLTQHFPDLSKLFALDCADLMALGLSDQQAQEVSRPNWRAVEQLLAWSEQPGHTVIDYYDSSYPPLLKEIQQPPPVLFIKGDPHVLAEPQIAMVGSRAPSACGLALAERFAAELTEHGLVITSGMALGIDTASHGGALPTGRTIAVLGSGLDNIYPRQNRKLADKIAENGAIISEFPLNMAPLARNFPVRNRIVSGLSLGVLVVEATIKSGSLITARLAGDQGREVFAMPGSVLQPLARGCHQLLRQGATLVETVADILVELAPLLGVNEKVKPKNNQLAGLPALSQPVEQLLQQMPFAPITIEQLQQVNGSTAQQLMSMLLILELNGCISRVGSSYERVR